MNVHLGERLLHVEIPSLSMVPKVSFLPGMPFTDHETLSATHAACSHPGSNTALNGCFSPGASRTREGRMLARTAGCLGSSVWPVAVSDTSASAHVANPAINRRLNFGHMEISFFVDRFRRNRPYFGADLSTPIRSLPTKMAYTIPSLSTVAQFSAWAFTFRVRLAT